jgi:2-iminobutanoate/2-iminopropanoate deaminase
MKFCNTFFAIIVSLFVAGCNAPATADKSSEIEFLNMPGMENLNRPFSTAVRVDNTLYLSGVIGTDPSGRRPMPGGIAAETKRAMEIIGEELETFGSSMERIVKCTIFLADIDEWGAMNEVYVTFFDTPPARSALGTSGLALGARMEIECIAVIE